MKERKMVVLAVALTCMLLMLWNVGAAAQEVHLAGGTVSGQHWGPWTPQPGFPHLKARSKCDFTLDNGQESSWSFQFLNDYPYAVDYIFKNEISRQGANSMESAPSQNTLGTGLRSGVFSSTLHGTCKELDGMKTQVLCVLPKGEVERCYEKYHLPRPTPENSVNLRESTSTELGPPKDAKGGPTPSALAETKPENPFSRFTTRCFIEIENYDQSAGAKDPITDALRSLIPLNIATYGHLQSEPFNVTEEHDGTVEMAGRSAPSTITPMTLPTDCDPGNTCYKREWSLQVNGIELKFVDLLMIDQSGKDERDVRNTIGGTSFGPNILQCSHLKKD